MTGEATYDEPPVTCALCGERGGSEAAAAGMGWLRESDAGRTRWLCPRCVRDHVRDIEGKLPAEYW
ncbi:MULTISPECIES: hypothetical protein [Prauserella salsuginis group]|uniref:Uncharacterized protein n=1 Tax=Prauserella salsuginis TaxID=387889 RepID=A0ABW6G7V5_9PSEU|nr:MULTISPECIES: hypothetical protein [Prauserella salsuginis group]MCR3719661.1 hypothetical protein [Prauserella flava]MCR3735326.1 hypothetical protein [Prauserella salsuginis]